MRRHRVRCRRVTWALVAALVATCNPASPVEAAGPSDKWANVLALDAETHVIIVCDDGEKVEGWTVAVRPDRITVDRARRARLHIDVLRERVTRITVVKEGRPWYVVPAVIGAAVAGLAATVGMLLAWAECDASCGDGSGSEWLGLAFAIPVAAAIWAYRTIEPRRSYKVIYEAGR